MARLGRPGVEPLASIRYHDQVYARDQSAGDYLRTFLLPGVLHCNGGVGPDAVDWPSVMDSWVQTGKAPERVVARKVVSGETTRTRPLCPYPGKAGTPAPAARTTRGISFANEGFVSSRLRGAVLWSRRPRCVSVNIVYDSANSAWQRGDYITALNDYISVLNAPDGNEYLEPIAQQTGELYRSY